VRLLIHDYAGHAFQVQLSRKLAARGHRVVHLYASMIETPRGALERRHDDPPGLEILGVGIAGTFRKQSFVARRFQEAEYGRRAAEVIERVRPDWVVSGNTPSEPQAALLERCRGLGIGFVAWVQDFYGVAVDKLLRKRLPLVGAAVGAWYKRLDRVVLRASDRVLLITEDFRPMAEAAGAARDRTHVIENWAPLDELPLRPRRNPWSDRHGLSDAFCFLYSGTLGMKHDPALLLDLARRYRQRADVAVVVVSQGPGVRWLADRGREERLGNLIVLPFQPFEDMPDVLASADVLVAILEPDAGVFSVPSKVLTYLCAERPLLASMPAENLAARVVTRAAAGLVTPPGDHDAFVASAERLRADGERRATAGANARRYAERTFDIERIADRFEALLSPRAPASVQTPAEAHCRPEPARLA
jgi:glycosyltransferase involved in cell wall biosynthesis